MSLGFVLIGVSLISLPITFLLFGRNVGDSRKRKFFYWINSTLLLTIPLALWFYYKEELSWFGILIAFGWSAFFNLFRNKIVL
jgi:hypothetical protein